MILILGGTSDSLVLATEISKLYPVILSVATEMGNQAASKLKDICKIEVGRKDLEQLKNFMKENEVKLLIDGTHPYAVVVSENGRKAASETGIEYIRYSRPGADKEGVEKPDGKIIWLDDYESAAFYLNERDGNIFSTLGSKNIGGLIRKINDKKRITARVLPDSASVNILSEEGLNYDQIIAMKGPFSMEMNYLMLKEKKAAFLLTKDSGDAGGFKEKLEAASKLGIEVIVIKRSEMENGGNVFTEFQDLLSKVKTVMSL